MDMNVWGVKRKKPAFGRILMLSIKKYCANSIDLQLILRYIGKVLTSKCKSFESQMRILFLYIFEYLLYNCISYRTSSHVHTKPINLHRFEFKKKNHTKKLQCFGTFLERSIHLFLNNGWNGVHLSRALCMNAHNFNHYQE